LLQSMEVSQTSTDFQLAVQLMLKVRQELHLIQRQTWSLAASLDSIFVLLLLKVFFIRYLNTIDALRQIELLQEPISVALQEVV
jgi:hypothetical protein